MTVHTQNSGFVHLAKPIAGYDDLLHLMGQIADETNALPFTSKDLGVSINNLKHYINGLNSEDNSIYLAAYDKGRPIGFGYLEGGKRERTHHVTSLGIGVLGEYGGQGIGSSILGALIDYAQNSQSIAKIDLQVRKDNLPAIQLYKKFGFQVEGVSKRALYIDGEFFDYLNMGRNID